MFKSIGAFVKANKLLATGLIAGSTILGGVGGLATHYYFSTQQMLLMSQQGNVGQLEKQIAKKPVNTNRVIYNVPPKGTGNSLSNAELNKEYQEVLKAIQQITGQPYSLSWMASYLGQNQNNPWVQWYYNVFPYAVIGYEKTNELPSIAMTVGGLVCKTGTTGDAVTYHNIFGQTAPNSKDATTEWQYSSGIEGSGTTAVGSGGTGSSSGGSTTMSVMHLKWKEAMGSYYNQNVINQFNFVASKIGIPAWFLGADSMMECNFNPKSGMTPGSTGAGIMQFNTQGGVNGAWGQYWNEGLGNFLHECGVQGSKMEIWEKFWSGDTLVQIAAGAWEQMYYLNMSYYFIKQGIHPGVLSVSKSTDIENIKNINFNKFFAGGLDEKIINEAEVFYNAGPANWVKGFGFDTAYWRGIHDEALVLFGAKTGDPAHTSSGVPEPYKQYSDITDINPSVTGKSVNTTISTGSSSSSNSSVPGLVKFPSLGVALLSEEIYDSKQSGFSDAVSSQDFTTQLGNLANVNLLHGQSPNQIQSICKQYNVSKLDGLAKQIKALISSEQNIGQSAQSLGPGQVDSSWSPKSPSSKWAPAGAMTILSYYHISTQGLSQKVLNVINYGGSLMGSPYVFGGKGELYQSNAQVRSIYSATEGGSYGYDNYLKFVNYVNSNGIKPNGQWRIFDCSGYVNWVLQHAAGITLGSGTSGELACGKLTQVPASDAKVGDLVIFFEGGQSVHVAFYLKDAGTNPLLLEAPCSGKGVMVGYYTPGVVHKYYEVQGLN